MKGSSGINSINSYNGNNNNYGGLYSNAGANYAESSRQDNFDCVCVPYDQCPARDVLGRKGDLILPLDPRNLGSDIEALDESNSTSNANVTRVAKEISESNSDESNSDQAVSIETTQADLKHITKREVSEKRSDDVKKADGEAVSISSHRFYKLTKQ